MADNDQQQNDTYDSWMSMVNQVSNTVTSPQDSAQEDDSSKHQSSSSFDSWDAMSKNFNMSQSNGSSFGQSLGSEAGASEGAEMVVMMA